MLIKPKICFITASELVVRWFLLDQLSALSRHYDVTLIVNTDNPGFLLDTGVSVRILPLRIERQIHVMQDVLALLKLVGIVSQEGFVAVHSVSPKAGLLAMLAAAICRVPVRIHTFQGEVWATRTGLMRKLLRGMDKIVARLATSLLVVSESERGFLIQEGIISAHKSRVLAQGSICGVDIRRFFPRAEGRQSRADFGFPNAGVIFLYLGRLAIDKGILDLVAAFDKLWREDQAISLLIVGPDEDGVSDKIQAMVLACQEAIHFYGETVNPESYIEIADVLCLPSYREGFGMVLLEAAAMGKAVLASRIYGITDAVIENETGLLHAPGSVIEISDKMRLLANDSGLRKRLGVNALQRVRRDFSREYVTSEMLRFYEQILQRATDLSD
ncbi:MAG: glycosyltransferase [Burkholderiales bacterium]